MAESITPHNYYDDSECWCGDSDCDNEFYEEDEPIEELLEKFDEVQSGPIKMRTVENPNGN